MKKLIIPLWIKQVVLQELDTIAAGMRNDPTSGICTNLREMVGENLKGRGYKVTLVNSGMVLLTDEGHRLRSMAYAYFDRAMRSAVKRYPFYTGDLSFPIASPNPDQHRWDAYINRPKWAGEYGDRRYALVERLRVEVRRELSKNHRSQRKSLQKVSHELH